MRFDTKAQRMLHPQARLIPDSIWNASHLFYEVLPDFLLSFMEASDTDLMSRLNELRGLLPDYERRKQCAWLALALSHPNLSDEALAEIGRRLELSDKSLFDVAIAFGKLSFVESLIAKDGRPQYNFRAAFNAAATHGHLPILECLMRLRPDDVQDMIEYVMYDPLYSLAKNGQLSFLTRLIKLIIAADKSQELFETIYHEELHNNRDGFLLLERLIEFASDEQVKAIIGLHEYWVFRSAAWSGHLPVLERLIALAPDKVAMLRSKLFGAFRDAAENGHVLVLDRLVALAPDKAFIQAMIETMEYIAFRSAADKGHLPVLERLIALAPDKVHEMIKANRYCAFTSAAYNGHLEMLNFLVARAPAGISEWYGVAFCDAARGGHLHVMKRLMALNPGLILDQADQVLRNATDYRHAPIINWLLSFPRMLAHAEAHDREYGQQHVYPFVRNLLTTLRSQKADAEAANPRAVFNIDAEQARLYFYVIRNLIRRNAPELHDDILFLLEIPAVKALAHIAVTPHQPNELLRLAMAVGNQGAAERLLNIEAVRQLAEQRNFYRDEAHGGVDLGALAQDRESSIRALSTGEQNRMQKAITRYQPRIHAKGGVANVMSELRKALEERYKKNPATIMRPGPDGKPTPFKLPLKWEVFHALTLNAAEKETALNALPLDAAEKEAALNALPLSIAEKEAALKAYYQHSDHTALRYLARPNPWMHASAAYVCVNPANPAQKWSTFEEYQPLIAMLYLAAIDKEEPPCDGYTLESRLTHFITELALINRAHNWDKPPRAGKEYDDSEGDRPSCFSGVKRRLFQSVLGHRLLVRLSTQVIDDEVRDFVRNHFKALITDANRQKLKTAWENYCLRGDESGIALFKTLDITPEQQNAFIKSLAAKYGLEFTADLTFRMRITDGFKLGATMQAHVLQFGYVKWEQFLEPVGAAPEVNTQVSTSTTPAPRFFQQPSPLPEHSELLSELTSYVDEREHEWGFHYNFLGIVALYYLIQDWFLGTDHFKSKSSDVKIKAANKIHQMLSPDFHEAVEALTPAEKTACEEGRLGKIVDAHGGLDALIEDAQILNVTRAPMSLP